jgi:hypothetical protein
MIRRLNTSRVRVLTPPVKGDGAIRIQALPNADGGQPPAFAGNVDNLYEEVGETSIEVAKAGFSPEGGKSSRIWQVNPTDIDDLTGAFTAILGTCAYDASGTGKLVRTLPLADPLYPWLYASAVPTVEGYGKVTKTAADPELEAPSFPFGSFWGAYRLTVESLQRPFPILSDASVNTYTGSYYDDAGSQQSFTVAEEQFRFCTWDLVPQADYVTQQRGRMLFNSSDSADGKMFQAMPRFLLPNQLYTVNWFYVPVRLAVSANSYLKRWRGRVNQNAFYGPDGLAFDPGELLYLNFGVKLFTPPVPARGSLGGEGGTIFSTEKFCNVQLTFLATSRTVYSAPSGDPANRNYVVGGHNLQPWSDGNFRYAQVDDATRRPTFLSAPLETLFTDCDSPGGVP